MAEKVLSALVKGAQQTAKGKVKAVGRRAVKGLKIPSVYNLGLGIGPTLANMKKAYAADNRATREKADLPAKQTYSFSDNIVKGSNTNSGLSAIASILTDIRRISYAQLQLSRTQLRNTDGGRAKFAKMEEDLERPGLSSLGTEDTSKIGKGGGLVDFIKNNPMLSTLLGGILITFSKDFKDAIFGGENAKLIHKAASDITTTVGKSLADAIGLQIKSPELQKVLGSIITGALLGSVFGKRGALAGAAAMTYNTMSDAPDEKGEGGPSLGGNIATILGTIGLSFLPWGKILKGAGKKIFGGGKPAPTITPTAPPGGSVGPTPGAATPKIIVPPSVGNGPRSAEAAKSMADAAKGTAQKGTLRGAIELIKRVAAKIGLQRLATLIATRLGLAAATGAAVGAVGGPLAIVTTALSVGLTLWSLYTIIEEIEEAYDASKGVTDNDPLKGSNMSAPTSPDRTNERLAEPMTRVPSSYDARDTSTPASDLENKPIKRVVFAKAGETSVEYEDGSIATRKGARSVRNNNPGNLEASKYVQQYEGYVGTDGRFAVFRTLQDGQNAMKRLFETEGYRNLTVADAMRRYAPKKDGNLTENYINTIAKAGVDVNKRMSALSAEERQRLIETITRVEGGGKKGSQVPGAPTGAAAPSANTAVPTNVMGMDFSRLGVDPNLLKQLDTAFANLTQSKEMADMSKAVAAAQAGGAAANAGAKRDDKKDTPTAVPSNNKTPALNPTNPNKERLQVNNLTKFGLAF